MTAGARSRLTATDRATNARLEQRAADLEAVTITVEAVGHMTHAGELRRPGDRLGPHTLRSDDRRRRAARRRAAADAGRPTAKHPPRPGRPSAIRHAR